MTNRHSGETIAQLRGMSEADLIAAQDEIAIESGSHSATEDYRAALARRDIDK